jgi:ATP-dependent RNA helicase SUPV3L1/SUV3
MLPNTRHACRVPPHLGVDDVVRIQRAASKLPQVVTPADYAADDHHLDALGLILLQKGAAGARPSRWIAPALMDEALRHLDAVGNGPEVRAAMAERSAVLDQLGVSRRGDGWERLVSHPLQLSPSWRVPLAFRTPIHSRQCGASTAAAEGRADACAGLEPTYPHAAGWRLCWTTDRAQRLGPPEHLDSLRARLQAECAQPQVLAQLKAACTRAQDRWEQRVGELDTLQSLNSELAFQGYPDSFEIARRLQRTVTLYVGAPNSGKTHAAFERLAQVHDGAYLAPLRLLALEGRDRLIDRSVPCSLLTGEENVPVPGAQVVSSTIEMVNTRRSIDGVIDEAQVIFDRRGWAWTQAIVGVLANEIIICSAYAVPARTCSSCAAKTARCSTSSASSMWSRCRTRCRSPG